MGFDMKIKFKGNGKGSESILTLFDTMSEARVYHWIVVLCDKENLMYYSTKDNRLKIAERAEISEVTVKNSMVGLCSKNLLVKISKGVYRINPEYMELASKSYTNK